MTIEDTAMGEQPIFTCKAHVFHIDPKTKRSWIAASTAAVNVSFFFDSTRNLYRIISVEGTKAVINSTITPNMTFTKTSQKFGQWSDIRANTVYGLGFSNESELNKFIEKFQEVREATRVSASKSTPNGGPPGGPPPTSAPQSPVMGGRAPPTMDLPAPPADPTVTAPPPTLPAPPMQQDPPPPKPVQTTSSQPPPPPPLLSTAPSQQHHRSQSLTTGIQVSQVSQASDSPKHIAVATSTAGVASPAAIKPAAVTNAEGQLKYENERLKMALAQSSSNAKKWEVELATLKTNNVRLTTALQESTSNVEEWKRQLQTLKEENVKLRQRIQGDDSITITPVPEGDSVQSMELRKEVNSLKNQVDSLEMELKAKTDKIHQLQQQLQSNTDHMIKALQAEREGLRNTVDKLGKQLETALSAQESQRRVLDALNSQFAARIQDLSHIHREVNMALNT